MGVGDVSTHAARAATTRSLRPVPVVQGHQTGKPDRGIAANGGVRCHIRPFRCALCVQPPPPASHTPGRGTSIPQNFSRPSRFSPFSRFTLRRMRRTRRGGARATPKTFSRPSRFSPFSRFTSAACAGARAARAADFSAIQNENPRFYWPFREFCRESSQIRRRLVSAPRFCHTRCHETIDPTRPRPSPPALRQADDPLRPSRPPPRRGGPARAPDLPGRDGPTHHPCGATAVPFRRRRHQLRPFPILTSRAAPLILPDEFVLPEIPQERRQ